MAEYVFSPKGTCSRKMTIQYEGDTIISLTVQGGCPGNLQGIARLVQGKKIVEVEKALTGVRCGFKPTSCPDQFAKALHEIAVKEGLE
jgi:uncharacterized protein (TIGR03905 family)